MSALAVKTWVAQQLSSLDVPVLASVWSQRPKQVAVGDQTVVIVTCPETRESRLTGPRARAGVPTSGGLKSLIRRVRLDVYWVAADEQAGGRAFDTLLETLVGVYRAVALPAALVDPDTGAQSSVGLIGEDMETRMEEPEQDRSQEGLVAFAAELTLTVVEYVQG